MGRLRRSRTHHARRDVSRAARTRARTKDLDQIQDDLQKHNKLRLERQPIDEDKPGLGQHYCVECGKYYETALAFGTHKKSKVHRDLRDPAYTLREAEASAGLGVDNKQRGVEDIARRLDGMETDQPEATAAAPQQQQQASTSTATAA